MGITAAALLAVAPIAAPVFNSATEITAKADTVNEDTKTSTSTTDTKSGNATGISTNANVEKSANADTKADIDNSANTVTDANTGESTNTKTNVTTTANSKQVADTKGVYKVNKVEYQNNENNESGWISGTFPAIKDGKIIEITYNNAYFAGNDLSQDETIRMPYYRGYSTDQEYITFNIQRDSSTNEVTEITLPNGIPTYTKNGTQISTSDESNEAYEISPMYSDNKGQERFSNSTDITSAQKADAQKWESQMKDSFRINNDIPLLNNSDLGLVYIVGSDGWFSLADGSILTPQSPLPEIFDEKDNFFMHFNDNKDKSNIYFSSNEEDQAGSYSIFATATANDGSIKRNLTPSEINQYLEQKGGKGVTFHFGVHYVASPESGSTTVNTGSNTIVAAGGWWSQFLGANSKQVASKDVVVLPPDTDSTSTGSNTNTGNTGSNTNTGTSTNNNTSTSTTTDENKNNDETTTPATSYSSVYAPTTGTELYNDNGELITNVSLGKNTAWKVDQKKVVNGVTYLRVATNEWVKVNNGLEIKLVDSVIRTDKQTTLYNSKGERITNRVLGTDTAWRTDRTAQINGQTMYRVATNEWLAAKDVK